VASTSVVFDILARDRASDTFQKVAGSANKSATTMSRLGGAFKNVAKAGALAGVAAAGLAVKFGIDAIGAASDLNETISKSQVIFGKHADGMIAWADKADTSLGLSKNAALSLTSGFADMFDQIGFTTGKATGMSKEVAQLSADLGSFNNLETSDVADRMSAAFRGEYDSLQALIPNINAARVEQEALAATGKKHAENLTAQEKAAAVLAIVNKDGAKAQGDFARTSGSLANQQKILKAQLENVQASIGQKLLPVAVKLFNWFNAKGLPAMQAFGAYMEEKIPPIVAKVGQAFDWVRGVIARFTGENSGKLGKFMADVKGIFTDGVKIVQDLWRLFGDNVLQYVKSTFKNVMLVLSGAFDIIKGIFKTVSALLRGDWRKAWDGIKDILRGAGKVIRGLVGQLFNMLRFAFKNAGVALREIWSKAWDAIKQLAARGKDWLVDQIKSIPGRIKSAAGAYAEAARWIMSRLWDIVKDKAREGGQFIVDKIREIPGKIRDLAGKFREAGGALIGAIAKGIQNAAGFASDFAGEIWSAVKSAINSGIASLNNLLEFSIKVGPKTFSVNPPDIDYLARGTDNWRGGLAVVGENGPELVHLPRGSRVTPNGESMGALRSLGGDGGGLHVHFHGPVAGDPKAFARAVHKDLLTLKRDLNANLGLT